MADKAEAGDKAEAVDAPAAAAGWAEDAAWVRAETVCARIAERGLPISEECPVLSKSVPSAATS